MEINKFENFLKKKKEDKQENYELLKKVLEKDIYSALFPVEDNENLSKHLPLVILVFNIIIIGILLFKK